LKFFLDHDVTAAVGDALERHGHDVIKLTDVLPRETADDIVFATAQDKGLRHDYVQPERLSRSCCKRAAPRLDHFDSPAEVAGRMDEASTTNSSRR